MSAFLGGYITGRLRTRWTGVHSDEVLFRDTAHGLLAWAVATVMIAGVALNATMSQSVVSGATDAVNTATDELLRTGHPAGDPSTIAARGEIARLLTRSATLKADDQAYLTSAVAMQTGLSQDAAQRRVDIATQELRVAADKARKASSALGFFTTLSLLVGAFIASVAAAYGGRLRDDHETVHGAS